MATLARLYQWMVAWRPSSRPAEASTLAPLQIETMRAPRASWARSQAARAGSSSMLIAGTITRSGRGPRSISARLAWGATQAKPGVRRAGTAAGAATFTSTAPLSAKMA